MELAKIATARYLDIIFDGRNKDYGAYELRNHYEYRLWWALGITIFVCCAIILISFVASSTTEEKKIVSMTIEETVLHTVKDEPKEMPPPIPPPKKVEVLKIKTVKLTTPVIVDNDKVVEPPPTQADMQQSKISTLTTAGVMDNGMVVPPQVLDGNKGIIELKKETIEDNTPFLKVEIDAEYPGGSGAWRSFLERNLRASTPADNGATPGTYTVIIQFVVDKNGGVSELQAMTHVGWGMEQEAIRVIRKSGKWKPAIQNGKFVTAYRKQPITFLVLEQ